MAMHDEFKNAVFFVASNNGDVNLTAVPRVTFRGVCAQQPHFLN